MVDWLLRLYNYLRGYFAEETVRLNHERPHVRRKWRDKDLP